MSLTSEQTWGGASSPVAAVRFDHEGRIVAANPRFAEMVGPTTGPLDGESLWSLLAPGQRNRVLNEVLQGRAGFEVDLRRGEGAAASARVVGSAHDGDRYELWLWPEARGADDGDRAARAMRRQNAILLELARSEAVDAGRVDEAFARITEAAAAGLGCARASVWLYSDDETAIACHDLFQQTDQSHGAKGFTLTSKDYPGYFAALAEDRTIAADDCRRHPATREFTDGYLVPLGITSMLEAPIRRGGRLIGVLCNEHVGPVRSFGQEDQSFAANVADYVTRALEAAGRREATEALAAHAAALEERVAERTRAIQLVLDSTGEAMLSCGLDGALAAECSATVREWFGPPAPGVRVWDYLFEEGPARVLFSMGLEQVADDVLPFDLLASQMPQQFARGHRTFRAQYRPIAEGGALRRVLLVVRDASAEIIAERAERSARELHAVAAHVLRDRAAFQAYLDECGRLAACIGRAEDPVEVKRALHTLKGNAAIYGMETVSEAAHLAEDRIAEDPDAMEPAAADVVAAWEGARSRVEAVFGEPAAPSIQVDQREYDRFVSALVAAEVRTELVETVRSWRAVPTRAILDRLGRQVERVASRLQKDVNVILDDPGLRVPREDMGPFWGGLVHVVRNAVDHGIEDAETRVALGKPPQGEVRLSVRRDADRFEVSIRDDGRGVDWSAVARRAASLGVPFDTRASLERALFAEGLSTRDEVTETSGRGVGLGAVLGTVEALDGRVVVESERGHGTTFRFVFPMPGALRRAA